MTMIGVFDSGIGGLTVVRAIMERLPGYDILYFGDTARTPYGSKSPSTIIKYAFENTEFLVSHGARAVVVACNTASSVATDLLRQHYDIPIFEVIAPAAELAVRISPKGRIGIIGTRATIASGVYETLIKARRPDSRVFTQACPLLVPLVEEGWLKKPETKMIVKDYLRPLKTKQIDTLILGCTHYPLLTDLIQSKMGQRVRLIDSSIGVVNSIQALIEQDPGLYGQLQRNENYRFVASDYDRQSESLACAILNQRIRLEPLSG